MNEMDTRQFGALLEAELDRAVVRAPAHVPIEDDLWRGRRAASSRRVGRVGAAVVGLAAASVAVLGVAHVPLGGGDEARPASGSSLTDAAVAQRCAASAPGLLRGATVLTRADGDAQVTATVRSPDRAWWGDCTVVLAGGLGRDFAAVYPTDIDALTTGPPTNGRAHYEPWSLNTEPGSTATTSEPAVVPKCREPRGVSDASAQWWAALAQCGDFRLVWNDRRVGEVASAQVTGPDGATHDADVRDGYVSLDVPVQMTKALRTAYAESGGRLPVMRIVLRAMDGSILMDGRGGNAISKLQRWPSLAYKLQN